MSFERILWLAGMSRSGTNWGSQILASFPAVRMMFCPLFSYEFRGRVDANSSPEEWDVLLLPLGAGMTEADVDDASWTWS